MSLSRNQLNLYLSQIDITGKTCLDIGVQDKPTSRLTKGVPALYKTADIDPQWKPDLIIDLNQPFDCWSDVDTHYCDSFDVIFCIEVLEHCWNPIEAVKTIAELLKPGGSAYISTPFINPHHDYVDYLRFTNEWYWKVLPEVGFDPPIVLERRATDGRELLEEFYKTEGMRVSKIRPEFGRYTYPVGYFVMAKKKGGGDNGK